MNKNMRKMYSEQDIAEIVEKVTSVDYLKEHAVDITGLPSSGSMETETYANVINRAIKSKCVKLDVNYFFIGYTEEDENNLTWVGGYTYSTNPDIDSGALIKIGVNKEDKTYFIAIDR